jgi:ABC-type antimicrobial peptide transport system permease subunit
MNRIQDYLLLGGIVGVLLVGLSMFAAPPPSVAQRPRPTLTPTPAVVPSPTAMPPGESIPESPPPETAPPPQTLPSTGPSLLPVTGYGLTAIGIGFGMAAAALIARRARRRKQAGNQEHPQEP